MVWLKMAVTSVVVYDRMSHAHFATRQRVAGTIMEGHTSVPGTSTRRRPHRGVRPQRCRAPFSPPL